MDSHDAESVLGTNQTTQRRSRIVAAMVLLAGVLAAAGYYVLDSYRRNAALDQALSTIAAYEFGRARAELEQCLRDWPNDADLHLLLAQVLRREPEQDFGAARRHLEQATSSRKGKPGFESALLDIQCNGLPQAREDEVPKLLEANPGQERLILEALARGCLNNARPWAAHRWLSQWISRFPDDWRAYRWRGALLQVMGEQPHLAAADYAQVLQMRPDDDAVRLRLGFMLLAFGYDFEEALAHFAAYRERHPEDLDALVGIARCYREQSRLKDAQRVLEQVLKVRPDDSGALLVQALVFSDLEQDGLAWEALQKLEPQLARRDATQPVILVQRGELPAPQTIGIRQLATVYHQAARVLRRLGRTDEARLYEQKLDRLTAELNSSAERQ